MYLLGSTAKGPIDSPLVALVGPRLTSSTHRYISPGSYALMPQLSEANINTAASPIAPLEASSLLAKPTFTRKTLPLPIYRGYIAGSLSRSQNQGGEILPTDVHSCDLVEIGYQCISRVTSSSNFDLAEAPLRPKKVVNPKRNS